MKAELVVGTQYPWNKNIPVWLIIEPEIDSNYILVKTQVTGISGLLVTPESAKISNPKAGQRYNLKFNLIPKVAGEYGVSFIILENNAGIISTTSKELRVKVDQNLELVPKSAEYVRLKVMYAASLWILGILLLIGLGLFIKKRGLALIQGWIKKQLKKPI